jgi:hypothetical protein
VALCALCGSNTKNTKDHEGFRSDFASFRLKLGQERRLAQEYRVLDDPGCPKNLQTDASFARRALQIAGIPR